MNFLKRETINIAHPKPKDGLQSKITNPKPKDELNKENLQLKDELKTTTTPQPKDNLKVENLQSKDDLKVANPQSKDQPTKNKRKFYKGGQYLPFRAPKGGVWIETPENNTSNDTQSKDGPKKTRKFYKGGEFLPERAPLGGVWLERPQSIISQPQTKSELESKSNQSKDESTTATIQYKDVQTQTEDDLEGKNPETVRKFYKGGQFLPDRAQRGGVWVERQQNLTNPQPRDPEHVDAWPV